MSLWAGGLFAARYNPTIEKSPILVYYLGIMGSLADKTGIIRITKQTPDEQGLSSLVRAFFSYLLVLRDDEFLEVVFRNRKLESPGYSIEDIIVTHRTPGPMVKVQNQFRKAWALLGANQQLRVIFSVESIYDSNYQQPIKRPDSAVLQSGDA